jgi:hypothetical protein
VNANSPPAAWTALAIPQAIERLFATPKTIPRIPRMTPGIASSKTVRSIKASPRPVLEGEYYTVRDVGYPLASPDTHGKDGASTNRHKMCEFGHTRAWNWSVFGLS